MRVVIAVADLMARSRIEAAARAAGLDVDARRQIPDPSEEVPALLVADLDQPGALDRLKVWREVHPDSPVTGFAFHVNTDVIAAAKAMNVTVTAHGADPGTLFGNLAGGGDV